MSPLLDRITDKGARGKILRGGKLSLKEEKRMVNVWKKDRCKRRRGKKIDSGCQKKKKKKKMERLKGQLEKESHLIKSERKMK